MGERSRPRIHRSLVCAVIGAMLFGCGTADKSPGDPTGTNSICLESAAADNDSDEDGITDGDERGDCASPAVDSDSDGVPDYLDPDSDNDGVTDDADLCRRVADAEQGDCNADGIGDACAPPSSVLFEKCGPAGDCGCGLTCEANVCRGSNGQLCTQDDQCVDTCIQGTCVPLANPGAVCESNGDCVSGYCNGTKKCQLLYQEPVIGAICVGGGTLANTCNREITPATSCSWDCSCDDNGGCYEADRNHCLSLGGSWAGRDYWDSHCVIPNTPL